MGHRSCLLAMSVLLGACSSSQTTQRIPVTSPQPAGPTTPPLAPRINASATLRDAVGARVGSATFTDTYAGILIVANVTGIGLGAHGVHIHETGKCEAPFTSAGAHFNPENRHHGFQAREGQHIGDLPNIDMPAAGRLKFEFLLPGIRLTGGNNALLDGDGASIVIHTARDDYVTDPAGGSGARLACGVITAR